MPIEWAGECFIIDTLNQRIGGRAICRLDVYRMMLKENCFRGIIIEYSL